MFTVTSNYFNEIPCATYEEARRIAEQKAAEIISRLTPYDLKVNKRENEMIFISEDGNEDYYIDAVNV